MKKTLLITTALVAVISATDAYSQVLEDLVVNDTQNISDQGEPNYPYYYQSITVGENGALDLNTSDIATEEDVTIKGTLIANKSALASGKDNEVNGTIGNMSFDGATANLTDSDLESTGDITISGTSLSNKGTITDNLTPFIKYGEEDGIDMDNLYGIWAEGDISVDNSNISLEKSYMGAVGTLNISDNSSLTLKTSRIDADAITIDDTTINATNSAIHGMFDITVNSGETTLDNAELTVDVGEADSNGEYKQGKFTLNDGTINLKNGGSFGVEISDGTTLSQGSVKIAGGKVNVEKSGHIVASSIDMSGGEINVNQNTVLNLVRQATFDENNNIEYTEFATIDLSGDGTVNLSGTLNGSINGSGGNLNFNSSTSNISGNVTGTNLSFDSNHSLSKAVNGTIGDLTSLNVKKGTLTFDKTVGSINNLNVDGTLDIGTNTITATTANFNDNSKLALKIASADTFGKVNANTINIGDETTMSVTLDNGIVANGETKEFQVMNGTMSGDFTNKIADNSRYDIVWGDSNGKLTITGAATASDVVSDAGGSSANAGTAEAWDSVTQSSSVSESAKEVSSVLNNLSQNANTSEGKKAYVEALTALAPEIAPVIQQTATETINQVVNAVSTRLTGGGSMSTGGKGASVGGKGNHMSKGHKGGHGHKNTNGHRNHRGGASGDSFFEKAALWVQTLFNKSELEDTSSSSGFDSETTGIAFGSEKSVTDNTKIGLGYAYSQTDIDALNRATDVETHTAILYGEYKPSQWYINGVVTYGWSDYTEHKNVAGVNVEAKYDAESFGLQTMTGYEMNAQGYTIVPEVGLRFVHIEQDTYTDTADQTVSSDDTDTLTGVIATKVSKTWELDNGAYITPEVKVAATYDLSNDGSTSVVTLANGSAYTVNGEELDKLGFEFSTGVTAELNDKVEFSVGYEGKFKEDYQDHSALLNVKYNF